MKCGCQTFGLGFGLKEREGTGQTEISDGSPLKSFQDSAYWLSISSGLKSHGVELLQVVFTNLVPRTVSQGNGSGNAGKRLWERGCVFTPHFVYRLCARYLTCF